MVNFPSGQITHYISYLKSCQSIFIGEFHYVVLMVAKCQLNFCGPNVVTNLAPKKTISHNVYKPLTSIFIINFVHFKCPVRRCLVLVFLFNL